MKLCSYPWRKSIKTPRYVKFRGHFDTVQHSIVKILATYEHWTYSVKLLKNITLEPRKSCAVLVTFHVILLLCLRNSNEKESLYVLKF